MLSPHTVKSLSSHDSTRHDEFHINLIARFFPRLSSCGEVLSSRHEDEPITPKNDAFTSKSVRRNAEAPKRRLRTLLPRHHREVAPITWFFNRGEDPPHTRHHLIFPVP
jgi:hypothetical protein